MAYDLLQWPASVYPGEANAECPEAIPTLDKLLLTLKAHGPSPPGYGFKNLGKGRKGLWQINLKVKKRQVRVLYAPYGTSIVLFRIHKKSSPQEQERAYELAMSRKTQYEFEMAAQEKASHGGNRSSH
jgi:hypothetical protein